MAMWRNPAFFPSVPWPQQQKGILHTPVPLIQMKDAGMAVKETGQGQLAGKGKKFGERMLL